MHLGQQVIELKGTVKEIFTTWQIRRNFLIFTLIISILSFCFYSLNLSLKKTKGNLLVNTLSSQTAEITAHLVGGILFYKFGARSSMLMGFLISITGAVGLILINVNMPESTALISLFVGISKFGISAAFSMIYLCFMYLIPTVFTATVFGYSNTAARVVTVLAPEIAEVKGIVPVLVILILASVGAISSFFII